MGIRCCARQLLLVTSFEEKILEKLNKTSGKKRGYAPNRVPDTRSRLIWVKADVGHRLALVGLRLAQLAEKHCLAELAEINCRPVGWMGAKQKNRS